MNSKVYEVIDAIIEHLQADDGLQDVRDFHRMNGFAVPRRPTISVGAENVKYETDTRDLDRAEAEIKVYVYLDDRELERGESTAWELASRIRLSLLSNRYLGGILEDLEVKGIQAVYAEVSNSNLHACQVDVTAIYYEERRKQAPFQPIEHLQRDIAQDQGGA
ncbi:hypothetical protein [Paenibacillus naphthalenovorans]|uniref:hypothetical protein n=1 Tax=Paenibacillus naphthalenovorans TaxID=162209 RepID=UPI0008893D52|nr:hypothetical protein [Paenibacillus naphthalenovorans]SDI49244.1 hypothetical protein SAMN05421868_10726 [Paenibacillus naphthalenovorans]